MHFKPFKQSNNLFTNFRVTKMLKTVVGQMGLVLRGSIGAKTARIVSVRQSHGGPVESDEAFDSRYEAYFLRNDIDGWEVRKGMNGKFFFFLNFFLLKSYFFIFFYEKTSLEWI